MLANLDSKLCLPPSARPSSKSTRSARADPEKAAACTGVLPLSSAKSGSAPEKRGHGIVSNILPCKQEQNLFKDLWLFQDIFKGFH